ncbi:MAG: calcium/sodium antiporter [Candidatus Egerieousia sp.]|nr:calcium/sodium antiporter [bacterium]MDY5255384.1 calcium/sodium antiporter [Candidatus Egerieousia sp.]
MIADILLFIVGLALILSGANALTDGASSIAKRMKVSELVIGLTIVAFGTSAPELAVSAISAIKGNGDIALGNVVGSNLFNTLMIIGCTVLVRPLKVSRLLIKKEIPLCILASFVLILLCADATEGCVAGGLSRTDGLVLLCFMAIFLSHTFSIAAGEEQNASESGIKEMPLWRAILFSIGGLIFLIAGGESFVRGASGLARALGASESLIAVTIVAGGTSLPELATSVVAALKGKSEMAVGNVVGSNLFNIFLILGLSSTISPIKLAGIGAIDLGMVLLSSVVLWFVGVFYKERTITRAEGALMIALYVAYTLYLIL